MTTENALPAAVVALFQELGSVLEEARERLEALLEDAIPAQEVRMTTSTPSTATDTF